MNKNPLLTVAIPTYNRSEHLEKILKQLKKQKNDDFVVLVSDDNSSDKTEEMVKRLKKDFKNITYLKNKKNLGYSGNVYHIYEEAKTDYVWFLCDDDTVLPNAITKIVEAIKKYKFNVGIFNCTWVNAYGEKKIAGVKIDKFYKKIEELESYNSLMRATFLSILVVKKVNLALDRHDYRDNIFVQLTLSLALLSKKFIFLESSGLILHRNVGYKYGEFFKFYLVDHLKAIFLIKHGFDNKKFISWSKRNLFSSLQLYLSQKLGLFKYQGKPSRKTISLIIKYYGFYSVFIAFFKVLYLLIPTFALKIIYFIRLIMIHGRMNAYKVYSSNIDRAITDNRKTGFTTYR